MSQIESVWLVSNRGIEERKGSKVEQFSWKALDKFISHFDQLYIARKRNSSLSSSVPTFELEGNPLQNYRIIRFLKYLGVLNQSKPGRYKPTGETLRDSYNASDHALAVDVSKILSEGRT